MGRGGMLPRPFSFLLKVEDSVSRDFGKALQVIEHWECGRDIRADAKRVRCLRLHEGFLLNALEAVYNSAGVNLRRRRFPLATNRA
jgi:hypothetical protein